MKLLIRFELFLLTPIDGTTVFEYVWRKEDSIKLSSTRWSKEEKAETQIHIFQEWLHFVQLPLKWHMQMKMFTPFHFTEYLHLSSWILLDQVYFDPFYTLWQLTYNSCARYIVVHLMFGVWSILQASHSFEWFNYIMMTTGIKNHYPFMPYRQLCWVVNADKDSFLLTAPKQGFKPQQTPYYSES